MATLSTTRNYADGSDLTEQNLDDAFDSIETFVNTTKLTGADNIQSGSIEAGQIASGAVTNTKLATDAVSTVKIQDDAVTAAKIADGAIDAAAKLVDSVVTTAKINANAVTPGKRSLRTSPGATAALGEVAISASSSTFTTNSTSFVDATNLSVSLTTQGGAVELKLVNDASGSASVITASAGGQLIILRGATEVSRHPIVGNEAYTYGAFSQTEAPSAGTYTYKVQVKNDAAGTFTLQYAKLVAYEVL